MSYFGWEIGNCFKSASARPSGRNVHCTIMNELLENGRGIFCNRHVGAISVGPAKGVEGGVAQAQPAFVVGSMESNGIAKA
jgi:hypothetical protein